MHRKITRQDKIILVVRLFAGTAVTLTGLSVGSSQAIGALLGAVVVFLLDYVAMRCIYKAKGARHAGNIVKGARLGLGVRVVGGVLCMWAFLAFASREYSTWFLASYITMAASMVALPFMLQGQKYSGTQHL